MFANECILKRSTHIINEGSSGWRRREREGALKFCSNAFKQGGMEKASVPTTKAKLVSLTRPQCEPHTHKNDPTSQTQEMLAGQFIVFIPIADDRYRRLCQI